MKISFPHLGNVYIGAKSILEDYDHTVITPPTCTQRTLELGTKYAPESICLPFKIFLGNAIESIEKGADTFVITGSCGPCIFGFYSILLENILIKLGYDIKIILLDSISEGKMDFLNSFSKLLKGKNKAMLPYYLKKALVTINLADEFTQKSNEVRCIAKDKEEINSIVSNYYIEIEGAYGSKELIDLTKNYIKKLDNVKIKEDYVPLKIGIVGDIYTIIEPFVNLEVEKRLGNMGIFVDKSLTPSLWVEHHVKRYPFGAKSELNKHKLAMPYMKNPVGGHGRETVGSTIQYKKEGFDGVIQILPLNCMPEIVAKSVLNKVEKDLKFPVMSLVVDEMTGEAGFQTRLEAFIDLINKGKESKIG